MSAPALRVHDLSVVLGDATVLSGVEFAVEHGRMVTVVGPNGAGKTTLVRALDGLVAPSRGRVEVEGRDVASLSRRQLARWVSYVPQGDESDLDYTVRAFVEMGRYPHLSGWATLGADDRRAVDWALERTETERLAGRSLLALSGGERQRAHIAAALAQGGKILVLDEPTSFLDYRHQAQLLALLGRLCRDDGHTIVAVTHDLNVAVAASDEVVALKDGRLVYHGPPAGLFEHDRLEAIFATRFCLAVSAGRALPLVAPMVAPVGAAE